MEMQKHPCYKCSAMAVWHYIPCDGEGNDSNLYVCDEHIHRPCSCNAIYKDGEYTGEYELTPDGRDYPCIEYEFLATGYYMGEFSWASLFHYDEWSPFVDFDDDNEWNYYS